MLNICGCLVLAMPDKTQAVISAVEAMAGCEVHAHENGRIVVTVEDSDTTLASDQIMDMHQIPGVLTVTLTYHHFEPNDAASAAAPAH
ncbi:MAG: chaperone NapD [Maritimibacter sp.]